MGITAAAIVAAGSVAAAGIGAYSSSQAGKRRSTSELSGLPYDQQLGNAKDYADAQLGLNRDQANLALQYGPQFAAQQRQQAEAQAKLLLQLYPQFAAGESAATSVSRRGDLRDFAKNSPGWYDALMKASPAYAAIGDEVGKGPGSPLLNYLNMQAFEAGPSALRTELEKRALADVQLGGALSPEQQRLGEQQARQSWSDRGLLYSNPAVGAEILNRDYLSQQRQQQRYGWGATVQGLGQNEDASTRQFGLNVQGANEATAGNWRNFLTSASQAQLNPMIQAGMQRTPVSPMSLMGLYGMPQGAQTAAGIFQTAPSIAQGVQSLTPLYNYAQDVNNTNFNASAAQGIAGQNNMAALAGGAMQLGGSLYGSYMRGGGGGSYGAGGSGYYSTPGGAPTSSIGWRPSGMY